MSKKTKILFAVLLHCLQIQACFFSKDWKKKMNTKMEMQCTRSTSYGGGHSSFLWFRLSSCVMYSLTDSSNERSKRSVVTEELLKNFLVIADGTLQTKLLSAPSGIVATLDVSQKSNQVIVTVEGIYAVADTDQFSRNKRSVPDECLWYQCYEVEFPLDDQLTSNDYQSEFVGNLFDELGQTKVRLTRSTRKSRRPKPVSKTKHNVISVKPNASNQTSNTTTNKTTTSTTSTTTKGTTTTTSTTTTTTTTKATTASSHTFKSHLNSSSYATVNRSSSMTTGNIETKSSGINKSSEVKTVIENSNATNFKQESNVTVAKDSTEIMLNEGMQTASNSTQLHKTSTISKVTVSPRREEDNKPGNPTKVSDVPKAKINSTQQEPRDKSLSNTSKSEKRPSTPYTKFPDVKPVPTSATAWLLGFGLASIPTIALPVGCLLWKFPHLLGVVFRCCNRNNQASVAVPMTG